MNKTCAASLVIICILLSTVSADTVKSPQFANLTAGYIDPAATEFTRTNIQLSHERSGSCSCTSIFATNIYTGPAFSSELIAALEYAQCLWSCVLSTATPGIVVRVNNVQTSGSVLASAGPWFTNNGGTQYKPCAMYGSQCAVSIEMDVDPDAVPYYFGTDGNLASNQYDFVTVVFHELAHGLGFSGFIDPSTGGYSIPAPQYTILDTRIQYNRDSLWILNPPTDINTAETAVVSGALYFHGTNFYPKLYAPNPADKGSSIYHFDEGTYPKGDPESLMTPIIFNGEANHTPGQNLCDLLVTIGYRIINPAVCGGTPISPTASRTPSPIVPSGSRTPSVASPSRTPTGTSSRMVPSPSRTPSAVSHSRTPTHAPPSSSPSRTPSHSKNPSGSRTPTKISSVSRTPTPASHSRTPSAVSHSRTPTRSPTHASPSRTSSRTPTHLA